MGGGGGAGGYDHVADSLTAKTGQTGRMPRLI